MVSEGTQKGAGNTEGHQRQGHAVWFYFQEAGLSLLEDYRKNWEKPSEGVHKNAWYGTATSGFNFFQPFMHQNLKPCCSILATNLRSCWPNSDL